MDTAFISLLHASFGVKLPTFTPSVPTEFDACLTANTSSACPLALRHAPASNTGHFYGICSWMTGMFPISQNNPPSTSAVILKGHGIFVPGHQPTLQL